MDLAFEAIKNATDNISKLYTKHKIENYFRPGLTFSKQFEEHLEMLNRAVGSMEKLMVSSSPKHLKPRKKVRTELFEKTIDEVNSVSEMSPTPPPSEVDVQEKQLETNLRSRKRKVDSSPEKINEKKKEKIVDDSLLSTEMNDTKEYEVKCVKDYIKKNGKEYYHVSWKGYDSDDDTFEPVEHLEDCDSLLEKFVLQRLKERQHCTTAEELNDLQIPVHASARNALFSAFEIFYKYKSKKPPTKAIALLNEKSKKTKEELLNLIIRYVSIKDPSLEKYEKIAVMIADQFLMRSIEAERECQMSHLRGWERTINFICSDPAPITVENNVDLTLPPLNFTYINDYIAGEGITIPDDPRVGCCCSDCSASSNKCCPHQMESFFAYTKNRRLKVSLGTPIYECNRLCVCPPDCVNRVVQKGRRIPLTIFRTANGRGWGVKTGEFIRKDTFVTEYVGEVISSDEAENRGRQYDAEGCTYLFDLDYNKGDLNPYTVDAANRGNVSHFINHSCDPNLVVFNVWINCLDPDLPKLALFSVRDIKKGEELSFDYNSGLTRQEFASHRQGECVTPTKTNDQNAEILYTPGNRNKARAAGTTACLCGAGNCRKFFF